MELYIQILNKEQKSFIQDFVKATKEGALTKLRRCDMLNLLTLRPYPILQILSSCRPYAKLYVDKLIIEALQQLLDEYETATATDKMNNVLLSARLLSFLTNFPLDILDALSLKQRLVEPPLILTYNDQTYAALFSRKESPLLHDILEQLQATVWQDCNRTTTLKDFILHQALNNKMHFAPLLCTQPYHEIFNIKSNVVRNNFIIARLVAVLSNESTPLHEISCCLEECLNTFVTTGLPAEWQSMHRFFYVDFQRQRINSDFLRKYANNKEIVTNVSTLLSATSLLELIYKFEIDVSFDETRTAICTLNQWQQKLFSHKNLYDLEMETLIYYASLVNVFDMIIAPVTNNDNNNNNNNSHRAEYLSNKVQQLNSILRHVHNLEILCDMLENIFQLVFLRWEHLHLELIKAKYQQQQQHNRKNKTSSDINSSDGDLLSAPMLKRSLLQNAQQHGFICRGDALNALFSMLKNYVAKKVHSEDYKQSTVQLQQRFQAALNVINEALWKYAVVEKIDDTRSLMDKQLQLNSCNLQAEELLQLVQQHKNDKKERSSSDDESRDGRYIYASLNRRKNAGKKRRRATISGASNTAEEAATLLMSSVTAAQNISTDPVATLKARNLIVHYSDRGIIPRMLAAPEDLAAIALSLKNFDDVKFIIKTFKLDSTNLCRELNFVEEQQQTKEKLTLICNNYQTQEELICQSQVPRQAPDTMDQIKRIAARGFEMSKIVNIIGNFAQTHAIKQSAEIKDLLAKQTNNAPYAELLQQLHEAHLGIVPILDLILNLPLNDEMVANVMSIIRKQQETFHNCSIGVATFLENLNSCMRCIPHNTLSQLLTDNYYSLRPPRLELEVQREQIFFELFKQPLSQMQSIQDLRATVAFFQNLAAKHNYHMRLIYYIKHLQKLLHLRDKNLHYHTNDLLKLDACQLIGELIFEQHMTPLEIESVVSALNLNLVHVIALNICPEIIYDRRPEGSIKRTLKQESIISYIKHQNALLAALLQGICDKSRKCALSKTFTRYLQLPELAAYAELYEGNRFIAALRADKIPYELLREMPNKRQQLDILLLQMGNSDQHCRMRAIDDTVVALIKEDVRNIYLAGHVNNINLRAQLIQAHFMRISTTSLAKELIENTLQYKDVQMIIDRELYEQLKCTLADITIYAAVSQVLTFDTWPQAYNFGLKSPQSIFEKLLQIQQYELCYQWCQVVKLTEKFSQYNRALLNCLLQATLKLPDDDNDNNNNNNNKSNNFNSSDNEAKIYLHKLFDVFPLSERLWFFNEHKEKFHTLSFSKYVFDFLTINDVSQPTVNNNYQSYKNYKVSLIILQELTRNERASLWHLIKYPLLILEQLIMNAKFELLTKVLLAVRKILIHTNHENQPVCAYCFDKHGHLYDTQAKNFKITHSKLTNFGTGGGSENSAFILLNFNLYQQDHVISNECVDLLLRIYATKALDYSISDNVGSEGNSFTTDATQFSIDSLSGTFQLPAQAPTPAEWVRDEEASHCMCCRHAAFTMLCRRHHCRRCGRVVCYSCSINRIRIPELYEQVEVRICDDCQRVVAQQCDESCDAMSMIGMHENAEQQLATGNGWQAARQLFKWQLSGNITHDKLLREEFCFEHAPSVNLCLSILHHHLGQEKCVDLLLYHCRKLEKLIVPNPEVDYELVAKMINCLALAAKVRSEPAELENIREHSEIIMSVVQNGCAALIPPGPLNNHNLRKLADSLVQAEKWSLALEVHLKCGFPTAGVRAAHGLACLRAGCFQTAREKLAHCMTRVSDEQTIAQILNIVLRGDINILSRDCHIGISQVKRPKRGPPLLQEILKIIEAFSFVMPHAETLKRASVIRNSNSSLASLLSLRRKDPSVVPLHEPALNVLTTLANLKCLSRGDYTGRHYYNRTKSQQLSLRQTHGFDECLHYLLTYGSHADILQFFMRHNDLNAALFYCLVQNLEAEYFVQHVFLVCLRCGQVPALIEQLQAQDSNFNLWRNTLLQTCRYLETKGLLHSLYQLQILLQDPVRAGMTCVKFYSMQCENFQQLLMNAVHLHNAHRHLQEELEIAKWEHVRLDGQRSSSSAASSRRSSLASTSGSFSMQLDARALNNHINTILKQLEVTKFLAKVELDNSNNRTGLITVQTLKQMRIETITVRLPTLFDGPREKLEICILILYCGRNVEEGFGLAYSIIQDYKLPALKIFAATAKYLARSRRLIEVDKLLNCITSNNGMMSTRDIDEILSVAINSATNAHEPEIKSALDTLTKKINNIELRISSHIFIGQLKSAYLLANKYERTTDIRRILRQAEINNQPHIKKLCQKKLEAMAASATMEKFHK